MSPGFVASQRTKDYLSREGIMLHQRGRDQRARYIERRGALLRDTIRRVEGQMQEEGLVGLSFESTLAECLLRECIAYSWRQHDLQPTTWPRAAHLAGHRAVNDIDITRV